MIVGFQAAGTPGRALVDGVERIRMAGEDIAVSAKIHTLGGFSAHASQSQLIDWLNLFVGKQPRLFLVHGEARAKLALQQAVEKQGWSAKIPSLGETIQF